jgi:hypothetical protein
LIGLNAALGEIGEASSTATSPNSMRKTMTSQFPHFRSALAALAVAAAIAVPAQAHHSFAMFDSARTVTLDGVVREFQWTNPHTWIQIVVKDANGRNAEWAVEGGSPNGLARTGWKRDSLKPGDHAVVVIHPLKDGSSGGSLVTASVNGAIVGARGQ